MFAGVSSACFYPEVTEQAVTILGLMGIPYAELFINCDYETQPDYVRQVRRSAEEFGLEFVSAHSHLSALEHYLFFSNYDRRFAEGLDSYRRICQAALGYGAKLLVFHGAFKGCKLPLEEYAERYYLVHDAARREGILLAHENVARCVGWDPRFFEGMRRLSGDFAFTLDIKQCVRSGVDPFEMLRAMGPGLAHLHISDHDRTRDCLPPGEGTFPLGDFLGQVKALGYQGAAMIELYRENFHRIRELKKSYLLLEEQCAE